MAHIEFKTYDFSFDLRIVIEELIQTDEIISLAPQCFYNDYGEKWELIPKRIQKPYPRKLAAAKILETETDPSRLEEAQRYYEAICEYIDELVADRLDNMARRKETRAITRETKRKKQEIYDYVISQGGSHLDAETTSYWVSTGEYTFDEMMPKPNCLEDLRQYCKLSNSQMR